MDAALAGAIELSDAEWRELESHVEYCASCSTRCMEAEAEDDALAESIAAAALVIEPPAQLGEAVAESVRPTRVVPFPVRFARAAAILVALMAGWFLSTQDEKPRVPPPGPEQSVEVAESEIVEIRKMRAELGDLRSEVKDLKSQASEILTLLASE
jgi:anti-sigma factor RsiW